MGFMILRRIKERPSAENNPRHTNHARIPDVPEYMMLLILPHFVQNEGT
jgi:hypothetical protein